MIGFAWRRGRGGQKAGPQQGNLPLAELQAGQAARITSVDGPSDVVLRLQEMGLRPETVVQMFRPGNPCILRVGGSKLCLRMDDGAQILVEPLPGHHGRLYRHRHGCNGESGYCPGAAPQAGETGQAGGSFPSVEDSPT